jgi:thiol-disulfide isomerase/thioredoxin
LNKLVATVWLALMAFAAPLPAAQDAASADPFFALTLDDTQDKPLALESLRGKPIIVNFWARWCGPCRDEIPELVSAYKKNKAKGLAVVGIALEENTANVREFAAAYKMDYLVVLAKDQGLAIMQSLGNDRAVLPYTLAIDRNGKVVGKKIGVLKDDDLDRMLAHLMAK